MTPEEQMEVLAYNLETSIMQACVIFGREAMRLGQRDQAIAGMGQAFAIAENMTLSGRCDCTGTMITVGELLERDGIREEVFARAAQLREAQ